MHFCTPLQRREERRPLKSSRRGSVPSRGTPGLFFGHHQNMQPGPAQGPMPTNTPTVPAPQTAQRSYVGLYGEGKGKPGCFRGCRRKNAMPTDTLTVPSTKTWKGGPFEKQAGRFAAGGTVAAAAKVPSRIHPPARSEAAEEPPCKALEIGSDSSNW